MGRLTRVLVVDDEKLMRSLVIRMLKTLDVEPVPAKGGMDAIAILSRTRYELVISDLQMPDMSGCALAGWIKHHFPNITVIIMTGDNPDSVKEYVKNGTADGWLFKPFDLNQLKTLLNELV